MRELALSLLAAGLIFLGVALNLEMSPVSEAKAFSANELIGSCITATQECQKTKTPQELRAKVCKALVNNIKRAYKATDGGPLGGNIAGYVPALDFAINTYRTLQGYSKCGISVWYILEKAANE